MSGIRFTYSLFVSLAIACSAGSSSTIGDAGVLADASSAVDSPAAVVCTPRDLSKSLKSLRVSFRSEPPLRGADGCWVGSTDADVTFLDDGTAQLVRAYCQKTGRVEFTAQLSAQVQAAVRANLGQYCVEVDPPRCGNADGTYYLLKITDAAGATVYTLPGSYGCSSSAIGSPSQGPVQALIATLAAVK
jgi:hypothetical protein